jgi:four helix bundle protein
MSVGMENNVVAQKSYAFAVRIVRLNRYLVSEHNEFVLSRQVMRSGTAIGALVREARFAQSRKDFIHKLSIALKEANETDYWIDLLHDTQYLSSRMYDDIKKDIDELVRLLVSIVKTSKQDNS